MQAPVFPSKRFDLAWPSQAFETLVDVLLYRSETSPSALAFEYLIDGEHEKISYNYSQLDEEARRIALALLQMGNPGARVLLLYPSGPEFLPAFFGCLYAGMLAVPAYLPKRNRHADRLAAVMEDAGAGIALTDHGNLETLRNFSQENQILKKLIWFASDSKELPDPKDWCRPEGLGAANLAFLQYTSGSTGSPKGVMVSHANLLHNLSLHYRAMGHSERSHVVSWLPMFHDLGLIFGTLHPIYGGFPATLMAPNAFLQKPLRWLRALSETRASSTAAPNFAFELCVAKISEEEKLGLDLSALRCVNNAAEPVRKETLDKFCNAFASSKFRRDAFFPAYGMAEGTLYISGGPAFEEPITLNISESSYEKLEVEAAAEDSLGAKSLVACGEPLGQKVIIADPQSRETCSAGRVGEIWVQGASVAKGYWQKPELSKEVFEAYTADSGEGPFLRTGDLGFFHQGQLVISGRLKDLIIIRGVNHFPQDIELSVEEASKGVRPGCGAAFSVELDYEERLVIVQEVLRHPGTSLEAIGAAIREQISRTHEIQVYAICLIKAGTVYKTSSGKIQRRACRRAYLEGGLDLLWQWKAGETSSAELAEVRGSQTPPKENSVLLRLLELAAEKLKLSPATLKDSDSLQSLGIDSLGLVEFKHAVDKCFNVDCRLDSFLEEPSFGVLATTIEAQVSALGKLSTSGPEFKSRRLSPAQRGLWTHEQMYPGRALYNIPAAWTVEGPFDAALLHRALDQMLARHGALRTGFRVTEGLPEAFVRAKGSLDWAEEDFSSQESEMAEGLASARLRKEAARNFELERDPLFRARVYRLNPMRHLILFVIHHLVADGWSFKVLWKELAQSYEALNSREAVEFEASALEFADWAESESALGSEASLAFWKSKMENLPPRLALPGDRSLPARQDYQGASLGFEVDDALTAQVKELARRQGCNLFTVLLSAYQILLERLSGQQDLCIGIPMANRLAKNSGGVIGYFVNMLPLRQKLASTESFASLLDSNKAELRLALGHQDLPLERLVRELNLAPDAGGHPLFQSAIVFQGSDPAPSQLGTAALSSCEIPSENAKLDLVLNLVEEKNRLRAIFEYRTDILDETTILRFSEYFKTLLASASRHPDMKLRELDFIPEAEIQTLMEFSRGPQSVLPALGSVVRLIEKQAHRRSDQTALRWGGQSVSYGELNARANQLAHALRAWGAGPEKLVAVCCERTPEMIVAILGVLKSGAAYLPLDPAHPKERLDYILEDAKAGMLLAQKAQAKRLGLSSPRTIFLDVEAERLSHFSADDPISINRLCDLAYVIYTSGSSGNPKGVLLEHRGLLNLIQAESGPLGIGEGTRVLQFASLGFDASVWEIFPALASGGELILTSREEALDPLRLEALLREEKVEVATLPPLFLQHLFPENLPELRCVVSAGESCPAELAKRWARGRRFINAYGPTESTVCATLHVCSDEESSLPPIGKPIGNLKVHVVDADLRLQALGVPGELLIGGLALARGYHARPELNAEKFIADGISKDGERLYRSGDLVRWRQDGNLEFLGRIDSQVKLRGFRIELGEIESVLKAVAGVREVAVILQNSESRGKQLLAYVVSSENCSAEVLRQVVAAKLPDYMMPSTFVFMDRLPLNVNGKLDKGALPLAPTRVTPTDEGPQACNERERALQQLFAEILDISEPSLHESFFSLGGHSLLAVKLATKISERFGIRLELARIFERPTIQGLAALLEDKKRTPQEVEFVEERLFRKSAGQSPMASQGQEAFWFFDQLKPGSAVYNMPAAWKLSGTLDLEALRFALNDLLKRHESLRTFFVAKEGRPFVRILPPMPLKLHVEDFEAFSSEERLRRVFDAIEEDAAQPFNLEEGPLMRAGLYRLQAGEHVLLLVLHHICADGFSLQILLRELREGYEARRASRSPVLAEVQAQYQDFCHWQKNWLLSDEAKLQKEYWKQTLGGLPAVLELYPDRIRPSSQSFEGGSVALEFSEPCLVLLRRFCAQNGFTVHEVILTAFLVWLQRVSHQKQLLCGIPVANRRHGESHEIVGLFMNTLAIRFDTAPDLNFLAALSKVRNSCLEAYAHQDLPFERVVDLLDVPRDSSRQPLIQAMLAFQELDSLPLEMGGLSLSKLALSSQGARLDLTLHVQDLGERMEGCLEYACDLFEPATAKRFAAQIQILLEAGLKNPEIPLGSLPLMSRAESELILGRWNETQGPYPQRARIHELFEENVLAYPAAVAVWHGERRISYDTLNRRANQVARVLQKRGIGRDELVGLFVEKSIEMLVGMLGILKAGGAYVPLDANYPEERLRLMLDDAHPRIVLTQERLQERLPLSEAEAICLDGNGLFSSEEEGNLNMAGVSSDLAYVIYTSGSTGKPKGVMVEHRGICRLVRNPRYFQVTNGDVMAQQASQSFDMSTDELWSALANGASLVLMSKEEVLNPEWLRSEIRRRKINTMVLAASIFNHLVSQDPEIFSELKTLVLGGEALDPKWVREALLKGAPGTLINAYGPTECTVWSTCEKVSEVPEGASSVPIGRPISNDTAYILDDAFQPLPLGVPGELCLGGDGLARGYWQSPELTSEKFISNPVDPERCPRLYRSGDLARWLTDGRLEYLGRMDHQVKVNGHRIELGEIEAALTSLPGLNAVAVLARKVSEDDTRLVAYLVPKPGFPALTADEVLILLRTKLPEYMIPRHVLFLETLPLNSNGKVDRKNLAAMPLPTGFSQKEGGTRPPMDPLETKLLTIWKEILGQQDASVDDDFFKSGGHSLLAVRLTARIRKELGEVLSLGDLLQQPSVAGVARLLRSNPNQGTSSPLISLQEGGDLSPLILVHPIGGSIYCYQALALELGARRPVFGIESPALSGFPQSEDLVTCAESYVKIVRTRQPEGPYSLAGWSYGALLAYEMARILERDGQDVKFLGLIDPALPSEEDREFLLRPENVAAAFVQDFAARSGVELGFSARFYRELQESRRLVYLASILRKDASPSGVGEIEEIGRLFEIFRANSRALLEYRPRPFGGSVSLYMAEDLLFGMRQTSAAWEKLCVGNVEIEILPGNHYSIMAPERIGRLASALNHYMDRSEVWKSQDGREPALGRS